jgi:mycothiol synthase
VSDQPLSVRADAPAVLDLPPVHLDLVWRPLTPADADRLHGLVATTEAADGARRRTSRAEVTEVLTGDWKDLARDSLGGFDHGGELRAWAMVEVRPGDVRTVRAFLRGTVHPDWRGRGVGRALLAWMEGRCRQKLAASGKDLPARLAVYAEEHQRDLRRLYAAAGFSPIRWYTWMRRDLSVPLPSTRTPDGTDLVPWTPDLDDTVRTAHNVAFADHWGSEPQTAETWTHHAAHVVPGWSFAAVDRTVEGHPVVGYVVSGRYEEDWDVLGYRFGYTELLGVLPEHRGRGLAAALLVRAMAAYREAGMDAACLTVDTDNPSGAHGWYSRLGYEPEHGEVLYSVEI